MIAKVELTYGKRAELKLEKELAAFEAQVGCRISLLQEMMAEIQEEMARQAALDCISCKN